jgi:hypothetical protein
MLYSLLHGNLLAAAKFNAWTCGRVFDRRIWSWQHHPWVPPVTIAVVVAWSIVRNLPFGPFPALRV